MSDGADHHAHGRSGGFQAGGGVDGVAGEEALAGAGGDVEAHKGLAGVDADTGLQGTAVGASHAVELLDDAQAGTHRPLGVVLVHHRHAEDADHGVADELLDGAAMGLDDRTHRVVVAAQQGVDVLGVGLLRERREADEVAEETGDDLAFLRRARRPRKRPGALGAEAVVFGALATAGWTGDHASPGVTSPPPPRRGATGRARP